eukprot:GFUD01120111.1.p1 GENE.GFUD01120111.1~~GFUD01120111.1.p1  ORF type:complete len:101 (+),score=18.62 GFUD01120111.1:41-343(+)
MSNKGSFFILILIFLNISNVFLAPFSICKENHVPPISCTHGMILNACGRTVCRSGPGDMCGGKWGMYGICGEGLACSDCNRCQGCSFETFTCWDDEKCFW